jgi:drug/metabolite transporter (DMT)-like permease
MGVLSAVFYAMSVLFTKLAMDSGTDALQVATFRAIIANVPAIAYVIVRRKPIIEWKNAYVWLIGVCYIFITYCFVIGQVTLSVGDASAIFFAQPVFVGILGYLILKEAYTILDALLAILMFVGVLLVVQPDFLKDLFNIGTAISYNETCIEQMIGENSSIIDDVCNKSIKIDDIVPNKHQNGSTNWTLVSTGDPLATSDVNESLRLSRELACLMLGISALASAIMFVINRKIPKVDVGTIVAQGNLLIALAGIILTTFLGSAGWSVPTEVTPWMWILGTALAYLGAQTFIYAGLKYEIAAVIAMATSAEIPISFIFQLLFTNDKEVNALEISGAAIVTLAVFACGGKQAWRQRKEGSESSSDERQPLLGENTTL